MLSVGTVIAAGGGSGSSGSSRLGCGVCVDQIPFDIIFICPMLVCSDRSRCFLTLLAVRPGHVLYYPLLMALIQVAITGKSAHACIYDINASTHEMVYTLVAVCCSVVLLFCCQFDWLDYTFVFSLHPLTCGTSKP